MTRSAVSETKPHSNNYEHTHGVLIEGALALMVELGADNISLSKLARRTGVNRATIYYHFRNHETLIAAVHGWCSDELAKGVDRIAAEGAEMEYVSGFVLDNPRMVQLWIDDFVSEGDIRERYPQWDSLVARTAQAFAQAGEECDAEVYCTLMLTGAFIAPHVFKNSVRPNESRASTVERFTAEQHCMMQRNNGPEPKEGAPRKAEEGVKSVAS